MVDRAKAWATGRGLQRDNVVHGEKEYRVPLEFTFAHTDKDSVKIKVSAKTQMEAGPSFSCSVSMPKPH